MVATILPALGGLLGIGAALTRKKAAKPAQPLPEATRDEAAAQAQLNDDLLRRKGGAADILTGVRGAEAPGGGKLLLGA